MSHGSGRQPVPRLDLGMEGAASPHSPLRGNIPVLLSSSSRRLKSLSKLPYVRLSKLVMIPAVEEPASSREHTLRRFEDRHTSTLKKARSRVMTMSSSLALDAGEAISLNGIGTHGSSFNQISPIHDIVIKLPATEKFEKSQILTNAKLVGYQQERTLSNRSILDSSVLPGPELSPRKKATQS